ncbi:MAG: electron transporter RnfD [Planctomycetota bacterium]
MAGAREGNVGSVVLWEWQVKRRPILLVCALTSALGAFAGTIPADHEHFQYTGRIDFSRRSAPQITWPGTYIKARFTGTSLKVILADEKGKNHFGVFIDGNYESPHVIRCTQGKSTYDVAKGLAPGEHSVMIFKRTEGDQGTTIFGGLVLDGGAKLLPPGPRPRLRIEIIGDSISCGLGNEARNKKQEHDAAYKNNFLAYGAITARALDAEYMCTAKSGIGLIKSWFPVTMVQYHRQLLATGGSPGGPRWDFKKWQPHIVVINLFQNDSWIVKKAPPGDAERVEAYVRFVKTIRGHYPKAHIFCTLGTMSASKSKWARYVRTAAEEVSAAGDSKVHSYIFKGGTGNMHPRVNHHRQMAAELTELIRSKSIRGDEPEAVRARPAAAPAASKVPAASAPKGGDEKEAERFYKMARQAEKMGQRGAAATFYKRIVRDYPDTSFADRARGRLDSPGKSGK